MTTERLIAITAALVSFLFSYFPAIAAWYETKSPIQKRQIMAVWLFVVTAGIFGASCSPFLIDIIARLGVVVECSLQSAYDLIYMYLLAIVVNQTVFLITPKKTKPPIAEA